MCYAYMQERGKMEMLCMYAKEYLRKNLMTLGNNDQEFKSYCWLWFTVQVSVRGKTHSVIKNIHYPTI